MKTLFAPAFRIIGHFSVIGNVWIIVTLLSTGQIAVLAAHGSLVLALVAFASGIYLLFALALQRRPLRAGQTTRNSSNSHHRCSARGAETRGCEREPRGQLFPKAVSKESRLNRYQP